MVTENSVRYYCFSLPKAAIKHSLSRCHLATFFERYKRKKLAIRGKEFIVKALSSPFTTFCCIFMATKVCNQSGSSFLKASVRWAGGGVGGSYCLLHVWNEKKKKKDHLASEWNCIWVTDFLNKWSRFWLNSSNTRNHSSSTGYRCCFMYDFLPKDKFFIISVATWGLGTFWNFWLDNANGLWQQGFREGIGIVLKWICSCSNLMWVCPNT